ncbi:MAG: HAD family hydrolase [Promethearchaeota archaeon]
MNEANVKIKNKDGSIKENTNNHSEFGIVFDFDGTLFDDIHVSHIILKRTKEEFAPNLPDKKFNEIEQEVLEGLSHVSKPLKLLKLILHVAKRYKVPFFKRFKFVLRSQQIYREEILKCKLFPDAYDTIKFLKNKLNAKIGLFSSTPLKEIKNRLNKDQDFLNLFLGNIVSGDMVKHQKPHPEGLLYLINKWKIPPENIFFVGDMITDIQCANRIGANGIGILTGYANKEDFKQNNAKYIINNLSELIDLMPKILKN